MDETTFHCTKCEQDVPADEVQMDDQPQPQQLCDPHLGVVETFTPRRHYHKLCGGWAVKN